MRDWLIHLPASLSETDLIAMVEGTLSPDREQTAIAALKAEPRLGLLIKQLRSDRQSLAALGASRPAPDDIRDKVLAVVDRRVIRELDQLAQQSSEVIIPISTLTIHQPTVFEVMARSPWMRRLPIAAGLLLAAGLVGYVAMVAMDRPNAVQSSPGTSTQITGTQKTTPQPEVPSERDGNSTAVTSRLETTPLGQPFDSIAPKPPSTPGDEPIILVNATDAPVPARPVNDGPQAEGPSVALSSLDKPEPPPAPAHHHQPIVGTISLPVAAELASAGRLVIIVSGDDLTVQLAGLARSSAQPLANFAWEVSSVDRLPAPVLALLPAASTPSGREPSLTEPAFAGDSSSGVSMSAPGASPTSLPDRSAPATLVQSVSLEPTEANLAALKLALESPTPGARPCTVRFAALESPLPQTFSLTPDSILWWNSPPARWSRTATIPVLGTTVPLP